MLDDSESGRKPQQSGFKTRYRAVGFRIIRRGDETIVRRVRKAVGVDISLHRPEDLRILDGLIDDELRQQVRGKKEAYESVPIALGCYLGEVFVRQLGGQWHFPNVFQAIVGSVSLNPFTVERYLYVVLGSHKLNVLHAAREAIDKTAVVFSLHEFYQRYAHETKSAATGAANGEH